MSAAIIGLPQEVNYGLLAFAPLGVVFAGQGMAAAIYSSALAVIIAMLFGARMGRVMGPRPALCILLAGLFSALMQQPGVTVKVLPAFAAATVFLSGAILIVAARVGLGNLIKYMPVAVLSGFTNGIVAMLLISALPVALGIGLNAGDFTGWLPRIQPGALLITGITVWVSIRPLRFAVFRQVPGIMQALVFAWVASQLLVGWGIKFGPVMKDLVVHLPSPEILPVIPSLSELSFAETAIVVKFALAIFMTAALETLATSASIDANLNERTSSNDELKRLGLTMLCISPLGMPVAGSLGRSTALLGAGAVSRASQWYYVLLLLCLALPGYVFIAILPQAAIAGVLIVVARNMVGQNLEQAFDEVRKAQNRSERYRSVADIMVMLLVAVITVLDSFVTGIAVGVVCAMALFIRDQSRSVIRRVQFGDQCHSLKLRSPEARAIQMRHGREIVVIEADGALFFGTVEHLRNRVEALLAEAKDIIIDLRRVSYVDKTAAHLLAQTAKRMREKDCQLLLSHLTQDRWLYNIMVAFGLPAAIPRDKWFADVDTALEYAEERLLLRHGMEEDASRSLALSRSDLAMGLTAEQLKILDENLTSRKLNKGEMLFRQGEPGASLFVIIRGAVSIHLPHSGDYNKRLVAFGPGAVVGEMALINGAPRSADALADEDTELLELAYSRLQYLEQHQPTIAVAMLRSLAGILSDRLRNTTGQLRELLKE
jgi:SulP family sulfate permease